MSDTVTDTQRLDFVIRRSLQLFKSRKGWRLYDPCAPARQVLPYHKTARAAIDEYMGVHRRLDDVFPDLDVVRRK